MDRKSSLPLSTNRRSSSNVVVRSTSSAPMLDPASSPYPSEHERIDSRRHRLAHAECGRVKWGTESGVERARSPDGLHGGAPAGERGRHAARRRHSQGGARVVDIFYVFYSPCSDSAERSRRRHCTSIWNNRLNPLSGRPQKRSSQTSTVFRPSPPRFTAMQHDRKYSQLVLQRTVDLVSPHTRLCRGVN